jgi:hypothetical protein
MSIDISKYVNSYEFDYTLPSNNEVIKYKPITTGQLKKLLPYENETNPGVIELLLDDLISKCVLSEGFDIKNLYLEDRFALLLEIRKKSKGEEYSFVYTCPVCDTQTPITINLNSLKCKKRNINPEPFKLNDKISFVIDHIRRGEQIQAYEIVNKRGITNDNLRLAEVATVSYAMCMKTFTTPEGDTDVPLDDKINILDSVMSGSQYDEFINWFVVNSFGVDFTFNFECGNDKCTNKETVSIPLSNFFV